MAGVRRWGVLVAAGCTVIALTYLPPRGAVPSGRSQFFVGQRLQLTPARQRAQALAAEWRATDGALRLMRERERLKHGGRPTVVFSGRTAVTPAATHMVETAMDTVWRELGLEETKVHAVLVIELLQAAGAQDQPAPEQARMTYLVPDSTDRTTCIAFLPAGSYWTRVILGERPGHEAFRQLVEQLKVGLGPCAFYAAFGTPGRPVRRWLAARNWDLALHLVGEVEGEGRVRSTIWLGEPQFSWYWDAVYAFPSATVACFAGRSNGCRAAVLAGSGQNLAIPLPQIISTERRWRRVQNLVPGERYLSDVARAVGRERFLRFWTSPLPVDTALAAALKHPVGEWTERWERTFVRSIRLGAAAPLGASAVALLLAAAAVATVALTASRRQVR